MTPVPNTPRSRICKRTNATNHLAWFWQPGLFQPWQQEVETEIFQNHLDTTRRGQRVSMHCRQSRSMTPRSLAGTPNKRFSRYGHPKQIQRSRRYRLPQHPGYPSGHAFASGVSAAVMSYLFPTDATALNGMATDAGLSTFDAPIHTQVDVNIGLTLGGHVGQQVVARAQADGAN
jgi:hypothetical protein